MDIEFYKKNGYFLLKNFFDRKEVERILVDAKSVFFNQFVHKEYTDKPSVAETTEEEYNEMMYRLFAEDLQCFTNCGKQAQHLISLHQLSLDTRIVNLLKEAGLESPTVSTRPVMFFNHPRLAKQKVFHTVDAHQDWRSMQGSLNSVVIWIPLIDIDKSLGALEILPGSHLDGLRTDHIDSGFGMVQLSDAENESIISVEVNTGDALLFSSFLIHQSGNNQSDSPRWSCHFRYNDLKEETFIQRKYAHPYIYKPDETLITEGFPQLNDINKVFQA